MHLQQFDVEMQSFYFAITDKQALLCISVMCRPTLCYADIFYFFSGWQTGGRCPVHHRCRRKPNQTSRKRPLVLSQDHALLFHAFSTAQLPIRTSQTFSSVGRAAWLR
jgi:hypothetical protein